MFVIRTLALFGLMLSLYAWHVEYEMERHAALGLHYQAACDVGYFSCSKVFSSEYGHASQFLGLPRVSNAVAGTGFYTAAMLISAVLPLSVSLPVLFFMYLVSFVGSVWLASILFFVLHDVCMVCISIYIVNIVSCIRLYRKVRRGKQQLQHQAKGTNVKKDH
eukprot:PhM_4_TR2746/c0_g1_i2/m.106885/K05357/VKORC1; vitamin-K-epoxide reductase (warfarin-sensitive)